MAGVCSSKKVSQNQCAVPESRSAPQVSQQRGGQRQPPPRAACHDDGDANHERCQQQARDHDPHELEGRQP